MSQASQAIFHEISQLLTQRRTVEAREQLERMLALDPEDPEARSQAGDVYAYTGAHSSAYKHYNQAAETYNRLGRADMALAVHHKILELDPASLDSTTQTRLRLLGLLVAAEDAIVASNYEKAVAGYYEAIRQFPNHTITYQRLASLFVRLNRIDEAADQYLIVARAFYAHGVRTKARPYFERVLELKPAQSESLDALLACLKTEGKESEGIRFIKSAVQAMLQAGAAGEAETLFKLLEPVPDGASSPLSAAVFLQSGDLVQAERGAAHLDLSSPEVQAFFRVLGRSALERGAKVSADVYFRWAQGQCEPLSPSQNGPAPVKGKTPAGEPVGQIAAAAPRSARQADRVVLKTIGEVCLAEGLYEEAVQLFERLTQAQPDDSTYDELLRRARAGLRVMLPPTASSPSPAKTSIPALELRPTVQPMAQIAGPAAAPVAVPAPVPAPVPVLLPPAITAPPKLDQAAYRTTATPSLSPVRVQPKRPLASLAVALSIVRHAHEYQLGELPPAVVSGMDEVDELIE